MKPLSIRFFSFLLCFMTLAFQACVKDEVEDGEAGDGLIAFSFPKALNPDLQYSVGGEIVGDTIYAYTLAGTDISALRPQFQLSGVEVVVNGVAQESGVSSQDFTQLVDYSVRLFNGTFKKYTVKFSDTGLPAIYVSTGGAPITNKEDYVDAEMRIVRGFGKQPLHVGTLGIRGRGNSTWHMPKKPYRLRLDEGAALLGMPSNRHWALMANYADRSLMRNDVAFEVSRRLDVEYTPRQVYVDLFLNGEYLGNYNLTEHIREGADRVNIEEENGGFILEADGYASQEPEHFFTPRGMPITIKFPDEDDISSEQRSYITNHYRAFEEALFSEDFGGVDNNYQQYFDLESFVNYYLANEITGNPDLWWSMRMYKRNASDPKIYVGPVWDFDLAFNNDNRLGDAVHKSMIEDAHDPKMWIRRIAEDPAFRQAVRERWNEVKSAQMASIIDYVEQQAAKLDHSQRFNFQRWPILSDQGIHLSWYIGSTYPDYTNFLKTYLDARMRWLDGYINGPAFD